MRALGVLSNIGSKFRHFNNKVTERLNRRWEVSSERKMLSEGNKIKADLDNAVRLQDANWVKGLLEKGARPESKDFMQFMHVVQEPCTPRSQKIVAMFLDSINVKDAVDSSKRNPLHVVEHQEITKLLLATGEVQINAKDAYGQSPLSKAVEKDRLGVIAALIAAGADIESQDVRGATPLHQARSKEAALLLLEAGAKVDAGDNAGATPLLYALKDCFDADRLIALVETYLSRGASTESVNIAGRTPLFYTMNGVNFAKKIANLLLKYNANLNHQDLDGNTPLLYAVSRRREKAIKFFLQSGANTEKKNNEGLGVMEMAVSTQHWGPWTYSPSQEIASLLASHGVRPPLPAKVTLNVNGNPPTYGFNMGSP